MNRRRFLTILAAATAFGPRAAAAEDWRGLALGADILVRLEGDGAARALRDLPAQIARIEETFSLYRASELTRLNHQGHAQPSDWMARALALCDRLHHATGGAFDPTVQPLWRALADGGDTAAAQDLIGWTKLHIGPKTLRLAPGQALTLNGMAQGFAADLLRDWLATRGFDRALVNMGEYAALGGPYRVEIDGLGAATLSGTALAISRTDALRIGGRAHILHPKGQPPIWRAAAVEADQAALADGLSTALIFTQKAQVPDVAASLPGIRRIWLGDDTGLARVL